ncbi:MAG: hypothetical protein ABDH21_02935 [bacterium]
MMNFNNPGTAPIFQSQPLNTNPVQNQLPTQTTAQSATGNTSPTSSDPFEKLMNKSLAEKTNDKPTNLQSNDLQSNNLETPELQRYRKQIEALDLDQLRMERKRLVDLIVKYMNEGNTELLDEAQKKYKIAVQVSDSKVMNFSAGAIAQTPKTEQTQVAQNQSQQEDFLKKLRESEILPPDNTQPPTIPQQTAISQKTNIVDTTTTSVVGANPNVQVFSAPTTESVIQGFVNNQPTPTMNQPLNQYGTINALNTMNMQQMNSLFSNPQGMFNSLNTIMNPMAPVHPYSPLMTSYGIYAPNLRRDPTMNAFLNGELYPTDMAELGVWSVLNRELFKRTDE